MSDHASNILTFQKARPAVALIYVTPLALLAGLVLGIKGVLFVLAGFAAFAVFWHPVAVPMVYFFYVLFFPAQHFGTRFEIFPFYFSYFSITPAIFASLLIIWLNYYREKSITRPLYPFKDNISVFIIVFLAWHVAQLLRGIGYGHDSFSLLGEASTVTIFLSYYIWRYLVRRYKNPEWWVRFLAIAGVLCGLEYIFLVVHSFTNVLDLVIFRPITNQGHITLLSVPLVAGLFLASKNKFHKWLYALSFILVTMHVLVTQKRVLWVIYIINMLILFTLYVFRNKVNFRNFVTWVALLLVIAVLASGLLYLGSVILGVDLQTVLARWNDLQNMNDNSLNVRFADGMRALMKFDNHWFLGRGAGARMHLFSMAMLYRSMDNSYMTVLFKGGIPWLLMLLGIYFVGIARAYKLFRRGRSEKDRIIGAAILSSLLCILLAGMTENSSVYFGQVYFWMLLLAITTVYREQMQGAGSEGTADLVHAHPTPNSLS